MKESKGKKDTQYIINSKDIKTSEMKVIYFDVYGRAEPLRMLLNHAKVEFEDVRINRPDWPQFKEANAEKLEFGQAPVLEDHGKFLA